MKSLNIVFLFIGLMAWGYSAVAQPERAATRNYSGEAGRMWEAGAYAEAAEAFKLAAEKISPKNEKARQKKAYYTYMSGRCYELLSEHAAAEQQYEKAILLRYEQFEPQVFMRAAEMQVAQCNHADAKENYKKYLKLDPNSDIAKIRLESCDFYAEATETPTKHLVSNVTKLNTSSFDYATVMAPRGKEMYFTSSRPGSMGEETDPITAESYMDLWVSKIDRQGNWGQPMPVEEPINSVHNEGTMCFDSRGKTIWFTRCPSEPKMQLGCEIYMAEQRGSKWDDPVKLELKDHDSTNVGHPAISPDGKTLIFASNMAGGFGGVDLWMSTYDRRSDSWSLPVNLGEEINTAQDDMFPTWGPEDNLYFASDGHVGLGGLDIYMATKIGDQNKWENPTNLGSPMNSCRDDYHIIYTEKGKIERGYISSNRNGSKGNNSQDIWDFYLPPVLVDVMILVSDLDDGYPIEGAKVKLVGSGGSSYDLVTDASGQINLGEKPDGTRYVEPGETWTLEVEGVEKSYLGANDNFTTEGIGTNTRVIRDLKVLNIEKPIRLPEVRYPLGSAELLVDTTNEDLSQRINSKDSLNYLYDLLMENPNLIVELVSHTDCRGSDAANMRLSKARAESCVRYLVEEKQIDPVRLIPKGLGETTPATYKEIVGTDTTEILLECNMINQLKNSDKELFEFYHQINRRTECVILSFDYVPPVGEGTEEN
ncbi:OmpA family protein [Crocinitomix algicola]|uniref:OmpA family protein n=1 Tax=Crocinitomix algicola TaxID=1740263 RepID=UPI00087216D4|nr:OmpA family protein [Crocinitomix algicola]